MANRTLIMISALVLSFGLMASACSDNAEDYNMVCSNDVCNCYGNGASCNPNTGIAVFCENSVVTKHVRCNEKNACLPDGGCEGEEYINEEDNKNPL